MDKSLDLQIVRDMRTDIPISEIESSRAVTILRSESVPKKTGFIIPCYWPVC